MSWRSVPSVFDRLAKFPAPQNSPPFPYGEFQNGGTPTIGDRNEQTAYLLMKGLFSQQLLNNNQQLGYDMPMIYGDIYIPWVAEGMNIRIGRFISVPGIATRCYGVGVSWTHFFQQNVFIRPEMVYYTALDNPAFQQGTKFTQMAAAMDLVIRF